MAHHIVSSSEKPKGLFLLGRDENLWRHTKLLFSLKGNNTGLCLKLLTLGPIDGRATQTGAVWRESGVGGTRERFVVESVGFGGPGYTWSPWHPSFLRRVSSSQGKINYFIPWDTISPTYWNSPYHTLWKPVCSTLQLFFSVLFCLDIFFCFVFSLFFHPPS